ncbi:hypothetical protein RRG08_009055 [Elysia crispata]|uniref:Uncharacterized protein n=1 Tax=Elysia crispata TaxID=231223 RepID=A0AAE1AD66_9GAST|nr:hypothetical protein RRG08_009055 [Elysia crispata]
MACRARLSCGFMASVIQAGRQMSWHAARDSAAVLWHLLSRLVDRCHGMPRAIQLRFYGICCPVPKVLPTELSGGPLQIDPKESQAKKE